MTIHHRPSDRIETLFREHNHRLVARLQHGLGVAPDIAEDACARAWELLLRRDLPGDDPLGWLYTVAKHEAFDLIAAYRREPASPLPGPAAAFDPGDLLEARHALRLLAELKPQQRQVLHLRAQGHSYASICELTGRTYTWVNRHVTEGRRTLREQLERC